MKSPLRILHLEDNPNDAELIQAILETEGIICDVTRVDTQADFFASLEHGGFDLILTDYTLPSFDGLSALKITLEKCPDVPFIFVSGTLGEEVAIEALKIGAKDYVLKERLSRIGPSVHRALHEAQERTERKRAEEALWRSEAYLAEAQRLSHTGSWAFNVATRQIVPWSQEHFRIFCFDPEQGIPSFETLLQRIHPDDRARAAEVLERAIRERTDYELDWRMVPSDGTMKYLHAEGHPAFHSSGDLVESVGTVMDVTERKRAERRLMAQYTVTQILAEAATFAEVTPKILQTVCEFLLWDLGALWSLDREAGLLRCVEVWHKESVEDSQFEAASRESTFTPGVGLPGRGWAS